ncbi:hypothetical protein DdX_07252 [Ditylenchus destructor]|uniref:Uncharacterized protein n=1 Tax=Ditylenchus destructor TaxID=166010 RepID=A0AAD4N5W7_9BILA|nr:hypothetical protein DdX_07252 [Ditylenchus destructor]
MAFVNNSPALFRHEARRAPKTLTLEVWAKSTVTGAATAEDRLYCGRAGCGEICATGSSTAGLSLVRGLFHEKSDLEGRRGLPVVGSRSTESEVPAACLATLFTSREKVCHSPLRRIPKQTALKTPPLKSQSQLLPVGHSSLPSPQPLSGFLFGAQNWRGQTIGIRIQEVPF